VGRRSCSSPDTSDDEPPRTLALASPRRVRNVRGEAAAYEGDETAAGGSLGRADDELEGQAPCGTRVGAVIVVLLVLAWAAGWFGTAGPPPAAPTQ
jgi:hypothetical protein